MAKTHIYERAGNDGTITHYAYQATTKRDCSEYRRNHATGPCRFQKCRGFDLDKAQEFKMRMTAFTADVARKQGYVMVEVIGDHTQLYIKDNYVPLSEKGKSIAKDMSRHDSAHTAHGRHNQNTTRPAETISSDQQITHQSYDKKGGEGNKITRPWKFVYQ